MRRLPVPGLAKVRRYQSRSSGDTILPTPLSADSTANGTRIFPSHDDGLSSPFGRIAYSHRPLRLVHSGRAICGRGYSGQGCSAETSFAQRVINLPSTGFQSSAIAIEPTPTTTRKHVAHMFSHIHVTTYRFKSIEVLPRPRRAPRAREPFRPFSCAALTAGIGGETHPDRGGPSNTKSNVCAPPVMSTLWLLPFASSGM